MSFNQGGFNTTPFNRSEFEIKFAESIETIQASGLLDTIPDDEFLIQFQEFLEEAKNRDVLADFGLYLKPQRPKASIAQIVATSIACAKFIADHWSQLNGLGIQLIELLDNLIPK